MFLWWYLQLLTEPILIYGTGNGAEKLLGLCQKYGVKITGFFSSDDRPYHGLFCDYPVLSHREILRRYPDAVILLAFGTQREDVLNRILSLSREHLVLVPDLPLLGGTLLTPEYLQNNTKRIAEARELLGDAQSRKVFDTMLRAKLTGEIQAHFQADTLRHEDMQLLRLGKEERYLDLGAYDGDTIYDFLVQTAGEYTSIDAVEPDEHNYRKLAEKTAQLPRVTLHSFASWDHAATLTFTGKGGRSCGKKPDLPGKYSHLHTVDALPVDVLDKPFTYVKMDVEGAEAETLLGMQKTLNTFHPKLCISVYHKPEDMITLPLLLEQLCPGYRMYLRRNRSLPAWEILLYAVYPEGE